jgi:hypothetical protein
MQTSEVQRPKTEMETKIQCSITKMIYLTGKVQFHKIQTEMKHLERDTKMQHVRDDTHSNKHSLKNFPPKRSRSKE